MIVSDDWLKIIFNQVAHGPLRRTCCWPPS